MDYRGIAYVNKLCDNIYSLTSRGNTPQLSYHESHSSLKAMILFFGLLLFTGIFGTTLCGLWYEHFTLRTTQLNGIQTSAILEEKYVDDSRQETQYWFSYRFATLNDDTYLSSVQVSAEIYSQYEQGTILNLRYQSANPTFNSLEILNTDLDDNFWSMIQLSAIVIGFISILGVSLFRLRSG